MPSRRAPAPPRGIITTPERGAELLAQGLKPSLIIGLNPCACGDIGVLADGSECPHCIAGDEYGFPGQRLSFQKQGFFAGQFEVGCGGAKGGGKSALGRIWLLKGNPRRPQVDPEGRPLLVNVSYIYHPHYRAVVLRKNQDDLDAWVDESKEIYCGMGATFTDRPAMFTWPRYDSMGNIIPGATGAKIVTGHLKDPDAYTKYTGIEFHRMVIEEAGHIPPGQHSPDELYMRLRSCVRSAYPDLKPQIMLNWNPEGPGMRWIIPRFVDAAPPRTTVWERTANPFTGQKIKISRIFFPAQLISNPFYMQNQAYVANLMSLQPESLRRAYLFGDHSVMTSNYFSDFRPHGPRAAAGEPQNANHVIPGALLKPWWYRWMSGDWGYEHEASFHWYAHDPDTGRIHIYRELVVSKVGAFEIGVELARRSLDDLNALESHAMTLYFSHDAFRVLNDERTLAELVSQGVAKVLGPQAVHMPDMRVDAIKEAMATGRNPMTEPAFREWSDKLLNQQNAGITIRRAPRITSIACQYVREVLRWKPVLEFSIDKFDPKLATEIARHGSMLKYVSYLELHAQRKPEVLPKLQIWRDACPRLIDAIPKGQPDEEHPENLSAVHFIGKDSLDDFIMGIAGFRNQQYREPWHAVRDRKIETYREAHPTADTGDLIWVNRSIEEHRRENDESRPTYFSRRMPSRQLVRVQ